MKSFFSTLLAILAAAGIIYMIYSYQQGQQEDEKIKADLQSAQQTIDLNEELQKKYATPAPSP